MSVFSLRHPRFFRVNEQSTGRRRLAPGFACGVLALLLMGPAAAGQSPSPDPAVESGRWERSFPDSIRRLHIVNTAGDVVVRAWEGPGIRIAAVPAARTGRAGWSDAVMSSESEPGSLQVWVQPSRAGGEAIRLEVDVASTVQVTVRTGAGNVELHGLAGGLVVETDVGSIKCRLPPGLDADVAVRSLSGVVDVRLPLEVFGPADQRILDGRLGRGGTPLIARSRTGSILLAEQGQPTPLSPRLEAAPEAPPARTAPGGPTPARPPGAAADGFRLRVDSRLVNLNVGVTDGAGAGVTGLVQEDFTVFENDLEQPIAHFQPQTAPLNLFLLLDLSGSTKDKMDIIKRAAIRFVESLDPSDRVAVAAFTSRFMRVSDFTSDRQALRERVKRIRNEGGGTAFYDALWYSLDELDEISGGRKVLVVMSDGVDNVLQRPDDYTTKYEFETVLARAASGQTTLFPIYLDTEYEQVVVKRNISSIAYKTAQQQVAKLAEGTGGTLFRADRVEDLEGVYRKVVTELRTLYSLSYYSPAKTGAGRQWRAVRVKVARPEATARTRPGYFDQ